MPNMNDRADGMIERWCSAGERGDAEAAASCLAADVQLVSPLTEQFRFRGRDEVHGLLAAAFTAIEGIKFHTRVGDGADRALFYRARVGAQQLEEAQLVRLDEAGQIRELTLFARPVAGADGPNAHARPRARTPAATARSWGVPGRKHRTAARHDAVRRAAHRAPRGSSRRFARSRPSLRGREPR